MNALIHEKSPYLQQHAANPVDWLPWGPQAFEKARRDDKPIFLSIGYSTCHWCHVMERESFESEHIAALLNHHFVPIKVDREERPDVDRIYMLFVQATTGGGGWPLSVWLTPDLKPFFGGTYFPPDSRQGRPGFAAVLEQIAAAWLAGRARLAQSGADILAELERLTAGSPPPAWLDDAAADSAYFAFRRAFDTRHGGFGAAPKFPRPATLNFLFRYFAHTGNHEAADMALATLRAMAQGGIHDHLGGGFHRYAVDERWRVPHFEKMLYDQAQLAVSYVEAFQISGDEFFARTARTTLDYVLRDMTHPDGGFYSAEDADSVINPAEPEVKGEGAFYTWTRAEIDEVLGAEAAARFASHYEVEADTGVLFDTGAGETVDLKMARRALLERRGRRVRPHLDDKVLTAWNALAISALAKAARALDEPRYLAAARRAVSFILARLYDQPSATLLRRFRDGEAAIPAFLDDYAFLAQALLDLYETDLDPARIELALALTARQNELFEDREGGGFFSTAAGAGDLVLRIKEEYDGAEPSGNSIAILNALRLAEITGREDLRECGRRALNALAPRLRQAPSASPQVWVAYLFERARKKQIVIAGDPRELLPELHRRFLPHAVVVAAGHAPWSAPMVPVNGRATAYVCEDFTCRLPVCERRQFAELLQ